MEELKCIIEKQKIENDNKIDCLKNEIEVENKELKLLKVEIDEICKKVEKIKQSNDYLEERIIIMIKKESQHSIENLKESQQKAIEKALKEEGENIFGTRGEKCKKIHYFVGVNFESIDDKMVSEKRTPSIV